MPNYSLLLSSGVLLWLTLAANVRGQEGDGLAGLSHRLASIGAVTGYEQSMVDSILSLLPGAVRDRAGNARFQLGGGSGKRLVVCPLDEPGYAVGSIREDGYLTLRRMPGPVPPLFDQQLEGHRVTVQGRKGPIPGVVAVRSIHLTRGRDPPSEEPFTVDDAYVDVGAQSRAQAASLGAAVLSPVFLSKRPQRYGPGLMAAPVAGRRASCAALLLAVRQSMRRAKLIAPLAVAFVVEQRLSQRGLGTLANTLGPFDETLIVDGAPGTRGVLGREPDTDTATAAWWPKLGRVIRWSLPVSYLGTPVETVSLADADSLRGALVNWIGGSQ